MKARSRLVLLGFLGALPLAATRLTPTERERLAAGEALVEMVEVAGSPIREGVARRVLAAAPERVYRAIVDYAHYAEFMPFVTSSQPAGANEWELVLDLPWPTPDQRFRITAESAPAADGWHSSWRLVPGSGNVTENRGDWTLEPFGTGTLVTLRMRSQAAAPVPLSLQERATRESLPWVLDGLRQHVGRCRYDEPRRDGCTE